MVVIAQENILFQFIIVNIALYIYEGNHILFHKLNLFIFAFSHKERKLGLRLHIDRYVYK